MKTKAEINEYHRRWRMANRAKRKRHLATYKAKHLDEIRKYDREYKRAMRARQRKAKK